MGIWIRSQNGKYLANVNFAWINNSNAIFGDFNNLEETAGAQLGKYDSEAEAIQVLDMIQTHIVRIDDYHRTGCCEDWVDPVFQMPPAGFSKEG